MTSEVKQLAAKVPDPVRQLCRRLRDAGFEAHTVGGAIRDALLGREVGDWDVATSASPQEVMALFPHTVPTGIQHGTVTVILDQGRRGRRGGRRRQRVEVTTFRGEGAYSDARRPDSVTFGVSLAEDLARRDFVINAIAFDPIAARLFDPFGGLGDLAGKCVRAVGDPAARFREDGLRIMRAIRFAAVLEFELDAATEAAIPPAISSLRKVSAERIRDELIRLLQARLPSRGLTIARRTGVLATIVDGRTASADDAAWTYGMRRVDAASPWQVRAAALFVDRGSEEVDAVLGRLKFKNLDRGRVVTAVRLFPALPGVGATDSELRQLLARIGRAAAPDLLSLWRAEAAALGHGVPRAEEIESLATRMGAILSRRDALDVGELALGGTDLMRVLGVSEGPEVGRILRALLERVHQDPALNCRGTLEAMALAMAKSPPPR